MSLSTNPVLADWDGDGLPDLILGLGERTRDGWRSRGVYWCRNVGTKHAAKFGQSQLLVADNDRVETTGICVADWNGDGRPDLIASRIERSKKGGARPWHQKVWVYLRPFCVSEKSSSARAAASELCRSALLVASVRVPRRKGMQ
jgi:hypothetical protein